MMKDVITPPHTQHLYPYRWSLEDAVFTKDKGKVFSCFACGGGSTMGYKIAGYDVIGCNEIDPRMMKCYETNHHPQYSYLEDIRDLVKRNNLPEELYHLDILDGSPPCSTFSMSGLREDAWGKIYYGEYADYKGKPIGVKMRKLFEQRVAGDIALAEAYKKQTGKRGFFNQQYLYENKVSYTLTTHADSIIPFKQPIYLSRSEVCNISTFPQDYHFLNQSPHYICGMSVPPVMMAHVASRIWKYWLSKL